MPKVFCNCDYVPTSIQIGWLDYILLSYGTNNLWVYVPTNKYFKCVLIQEKHATLSGSFLSFVLNPWLIKKNSMKKLLGLLALLAIGAAFIFVPQNETSANASTESGLKVGDIAPDFNLRNIDGSMISLSSLNKGNENPVKGYIITFTCNTCPYAVMYEDRLIELHNKYAPKGWPVVAIQPNDPEVKPGDSMEEMKIRANEKGFPFVYLFDDGQKVFPQYGATRTPHIYLLDSNKKVRYIGAIDNNPQDAEAVTKRYVEDAIAAIESGKEPEPDFTKAIGCGIKTK